MSKRKKTTAVAIALTACIHFSAITAFADTPATINADFVNFRSGPSTSSPVIDQASIGAPIIIIEKDGSWVKSRYNDAVGWFFSEYVTETADQAVGQAAEQTEAKEDVPLAKGRVTGSVVNIREGASTDYNILTKVYRNDLITIYEYDYGWARIKLNDGSFGWICTDYVGYGDQASRGSDVERDSNNSNLRTKIVSDAKELLGIRYRYGGTTKNGFDCSGFVQYVYKNNGISIPRTSYSQGSNGTKITKDELLPGDLVFFDTNGGMNKINHSGIYIGGGEFIHASSGSAYSVTISKLNEGFYKNRLMTARRYIE
jgi:cell wall-associated NlpC family hydrolase